MFNRGLLTVASFGFVIGITSPALAHCDNARDLCSFTASCIRGANNAHLPRVREGVQKNDGSEVFGEISVCGSLNDNGGKSCNPNDYVAVASAALQVHDGNPSACNQLPE